MITLKELLHSIKDEEKSGMVNLDDWRWPDLEHLIDMGFEMNGDYKVVTPKEPHISIYRKKEEDLDKTTGKEVNYFYIEDKGRETRKFRTFNDVVEYFESYQQPELTKNM